MIALGDVGWTAQSDWLLSPRPDLDPLEQTPEEFRLEPWLPASRHKGGANVAFCDGHVEHDSQERWTALEADCRRRWNRDHELHPEAK
jgi:prepilin-type processing-associated H-X9-DG protein